jgi:hypothetical protein
MNGGFLVKGLLVGSAKDGITGNSIFCDFQSICGLYLSSQKSPRITGVEGILIILNTMELLCYYYGFQILLSKEWFRG